MTYLVVLPILDPQIALGCLASIDCPKSASGFDTDNLLVVDNTREGVGHQYGFQTYRDPDGHNLGVARAWNVGARRVLEQGLDYLVILSASVQFGPELHTTFIKQMEDHEGANVIEATGHSWHLIAFHRRVFETIGLFDENFYPAYFEAIDFGFRMKLRAMEYVSWENVWVNAVSTGVGQHIQFVDCPAAPLLAYYESKWGGPKGEEAWAIPFGDFVSYPKIGYWPEHTIPELAKKYGLKNWW